MLAREAHESPKKELVRSENIKLGGEYEEHPRSKSRRSRHFTSGWRVIKTYAHCHLKMGAASASVTLPHQAKRVGVECPSYPHSSARAIFLPSREQSEMALCKLAPR
ncbi:hypothetical protein CVT26_002423 [Gymnopilus dilepis]|uniref:Uncharacterized protein n=1 Tax=Gymnopilus dilepis TaxID=231916 RepID=A0A409WE85_9AGAR|nr:hypothetical protein CVT26_002423 [Gymnopilus dilepis]